MNLIDRDKLIEEIKKDKNINVIGEIMIRRLLKQPVVNQWIPCKERLPKENNWYCITARYKGTYTTDGCFWNGTEWLTGTFESVKEFNDEIEILAWCELPKPYEEEENVG